MNKPLISTVIIAVAFIAGVMIVMNGFRHRHDGNQTISVKGLATRSFTSDLITWSSVLTVKSPTLKQGYNEIEPQKEAVMKFFIDHGILDTEIDLPMISYSQKKKQIRSKDGYWYEENDGYEVSVRFLIKSNDLEKVEKVRAEIGNLLQYGYDIYSDKPSYFYTELSLLKMEMLGEAAFDARQRAEQIAQQSNARIEGLKQSSMGVFQIVAKDSNDDYTWGGAFDTTSKEKTASITVSSTFKIK